MRRMYYLDVFKSLKISENFLIKTIENQKLSNKSKEDDIDFAYSHNHPLWTSSEIPSKNICASARGLAPIASMMAN